MRWSLGTFLILLGSAFGSCLATIDSAWFNQRTDCADHGLVDICYELSSPCVDSIFSVRFQVSTDGGDSWPIRPGSVSYSYGDFGDNVHPGTHCFTWDAGADMEGWEGDDFMVRVYLEWEILLADSFFTFETSRFNRAGNDAYVDPDSLYFVLTQNMDDRNGRLLTDDIFINDTMGIEFDFKIEPDPECLFDGDSTGGDGISFIFTPYVSYPMTEGPAMGFIGSDGWGFEFDIFDNNCGSGTDMNGNHTAVSMDSSRCLWWGDPVPRSLVQRDVPYDMADGEWHHVDIRLMYPRVKVYLDGFLRIHSYLIYLPPVDSVHIGFFASTGRCHAGHIVDNLIVRRPRHTVTDDSEFDAVGIIDTQEPDVFLSCPPPTAGGETCEFVWSVSDMHAGSGGLCSLFVAYSYFTDTLISFGGSIEAEIFPTCEPVVATVSVPDSFCNRGRHSCSFSSCISPGGHIVCAPLDTFTSCPGQPVTFAIYDTLCYLGIDSVWASVRSSSGTSVFATGDLGVVTDYSGDTLFFTIGGYGSSDGDTVIAIIDSVHYSTGCRAR